MNLDRYEKIDGREALRKIADKAMIYDHEGFGYFYDSNGISYRRRPNGEHKLDVFDISVANVASNEWYILKPFDVRQAMFERPNEWVGAYKGPYGTWYKVGFDGMYMTAIFTELEHKIEATHDTDGVRPIFFDYSRYLSGRDDRTLSVLGSCIPIEDVPEEATR